MKPATLIYRSLLGFAICLCMMAGCAHALTPQQLPLPAQGQAIVDEAGLLNVEEKTHLNQTIQAHRQAFGDEIVIVLLPSLVDLMNANALPAQDFATELFNH